MLNEIKDIGASIWISASAGTGKTRSLIDRIIALLLNGATPSKILCLTYTKAAATEMLTRLMSQLKRFFALSDSELVKELKAFGFERTHLKTVRELYERSLTSSEWVQIKTIHSFCFGILQKFPIETGLMPNVTLCSDYEKKYLLKQAIDKVIFHEDYRRFCECISRFTTDVGELIENNTLKIQKFLSKFDDFKSLYCNFFNVDDCELIFSEERDSRLIERTFDGQAQRIFQELAETLSAGEKDDIKKAEILSKSAQTLSDSFIDAFLTKDFKIRSRLCTKKLSAAHPVFGEKMKNVAQKTLEFLNKRNSCASAEANIAMFFLIEKVLFEFNELKRKEHCIDFDDAISMTAGLLNNIDWVMYKVDNSVDHLLIDEAQDTNPEQWEIIDAITDEFFANYGSEKTVFVVGDDKQSIYSFQGANVQTFQKMHDKFERRSRASGQRFYNVELNTSYRTTGNILSFVDDVFKNTKHYTNRAKLSGVVDIVDLFEDNDSTGNDIWSIKNETADFPTMTSEKKLAHHIADFIKNTIDAHILVESKNRSAIASDFMILFQRRDTLAMKEIMKALRKNEIPVSGIDRLLLKDEIIIEDLLTFAQFAVFPLDDLACACVLKSPIVGISENELMDICLRRGEKSLWECCLQDVVLCEKYDLLEIKKLIDQALYISAYAFFSHALASGLKEKFISRLGTKCLDVLYDFIDIVIVYERENTASLQSFLKWFQLFGEEIETKREPFAYESCVKLMTAHASKGLQAPFVLLADAQFYNTRSEKILKTDGGVLLWNFSSDLRTKEMKELCEKYAEYETAESKRTLYVALTRAEDYVCVLGQRKEKMNDNCWYNLIKREMDTNKFREIKICEQPAKRFGDFSIANRAENTQLQKNELVEMPNWFYEKLELSDAVSEKSIIQSEQIIYGDCVHFLLSELPKYGESYDMFADVLVDRFSMSDALKNAAKKEAYSILTDKQFAFIFDNNSLSELTFIDECGEEGRIDKVAFVDGITWVIDFKTGIFRESTPQKYIEQLKRYKKSVCQIFHTNETSVKTAILWTRMAKLIEINF